ncbi:MAG: TIGR02391 family protein [Bacilli bacterium]|nr:TIGR02391 family protein [Bacilli bacterium]
MITKEQIREDLYKAIKIHYGNGDYTEALRDAMFLIKDLLQEKSGLVDKDNTKLIEAALLGKNAAIKINKYETETEINFQEGVGFALKGLVMHLRNPISHDRIEYSEQDADAQLLYINYLISQIDKSSGRQLITDWLQYLHTSDFTSSKDFAQELIKELPKKQQYDLLVSIWRERSSFEPNSIEFFVDELVGKLSSQERANFINIMNSELISCCGNRELSMMFNFFAKHFYDSLKKIVKIHIEDIVKKGINNGNYSDKKVSGINASVATWAKDYIDIFVTKEDVVKCIRQRFLYNKEASTYIHRFFGKYVDLDDVAVLDELKETIKRELKWGAEFVYDIIESYRFEYDLSDEPWEGSNIYNELSNEIHLCEKLLETRKQQKPKADDLPF